MKMGTIASRFPYGAAARDALQLASLRCAAIQPYTSWIPDVAGSFAYPSIAMISSNSQIDAKGQFLTHARLNRTSGALVPVLATAGTC
jgi:hypothetical protein